MGLASGWELIIVLVIVLMIFGAGKLPKVARQLGSGIKNFQDSLKGKDDEEETKQLEDKQSG